MQYLITGATGNVGQAVLQTLEGPAIAGLRDPVQDESRLGEQVQVRAFDFLDLETSRPALEAADGLFLLRPPQLADIDAIFAPLIQLLPECNIKHVIFLSVQGAADNKRIPHHKIERLLMESPIPHTFVRPSYFMQNLETQFRKDIVERDEIFIPAGKAKFSWIDTLDIGAFIAKLMQSPEQHFGKSYTLTAEEHRTFEDVVQLLSEALDRKITFRSPNLLYFTYRKWREGMPFTFIMVMIALHYLARFGSPPALEEDFQQLMQRSPRSLEDYIQKKAAAGIWEAKQ